MHYHIVGIAGAGMSAIAHILLDRGDQVSGSDARGGPAVEKLAARGAQIWIGHDPAHVVGADRVLTTSAAPPDHPELAAARAHAIPVLKRADLWHEWSAERQVIAVAGTHGKTTTTAMIALILEQAGRHPGFLIGGDAPDLGTPARWGDPEAPLVIEADEYDRTFLALTPDIAVITNIEWDHVDIYPTAADYEAAFAEFAAHVPAQDRVIACGDDPGVTRTLQLPNANFYGIDERLAYDPISCRRILLNWTATGVRAEDGGVGFDLWRYDPRTFATRQLGRQTLRIPGDHNVRNALAAGAVATMLGVDRSTISAALAQYRGTGRRFELKGEANGITVIDDYAHHPTEVRATLQAARQRYGQRRLLVYFQPHTYSRTKALLDQWTDAFADADIVLVGAIYAAREQETLGMNDRVVANTLHHPDAYPVGDLRAATAAVLALLQPGDVFLTLGAGDGNQIGEAVLQAASS